MAESKIRKPSFVGGGNSITWLEANDGSNKKTRIQADTRTNYPMYCTSSNGSDWAIYGIPITNQGIFRTEFNIWLSANVIGITFWNSSTTYYRLCIGINDYKALFCEYYDGSTTNRIWTANVT